MVTSMITRLCGVNFLINRQSVRDIVKELSLSLINLEIGVGYGNLTKVINNQDCGRVFVFVDINEGFVKFLRKGVQCGKVIYINDDILKVSVKEICRMLGRHYYEEKGLSGTNYGYRKITVYGNIPYNISSKIIKYIIKYRWFIRVTFLLLQKEYVNNYIIGGEYLGNSLLLMVRFLFEVMVYMDIRGYNFIPNTKVDSTFVKLKYVSRVPKRYEIVVMNNIKGIHSLLMIWKFPFFKKVMKVKGRLRYQEIVLVVIILKRS